MNESEAREKALGIVARYGFTEVDKNYVKMDLKHTNCRVRIYKSYDTDSSLAFTFYGNSINNSKSVDFDMNIKKDVRQLMTKARGIAKKQKLKKNQLIMTISRI